MPEISTPEMKRLIRKRLVEWPPFIYDGYAYAWRVESEDNPHELVWAPI